jgi:uncharacterized protein YjiK
VISAFFVSGASAVTDARAQAEGMVREVQALQQDRTGVPAPVGLAFSSASKTFYVLGAPPGNGTADVMRLAPFELASEPERQGPASISATVQDSINIAFDARRNRLLLVSNARELLEVRARRGGDLERQTLRRHDVTRFGLKDPQGMAVDPDSGTIFILDANLPRILRVDPGANGRFDVATVSEIDFALNVPGGVRGLALDPSSGHLYLHGGKMLFEVTQVGEVVSTRDLSGLEPIEPEGLVFAPSGDLTDSPEEVSLYLADSGDGASLGQIRELSLAPLAAVAADFTSSLVNTVDMGALSPPSPDPSGITYVSAGDKLVITDAEVEETVQGITHFQGANVWELTRSGTIIRTANISKIEPTDTPMTNEPTGVTWKPTNGHYFITEDSNTRVYDLNPGSDGFVGTSDDTWTFFSTLGAGNGDPEGIAYDTVNDRLFVADGVNREIYQYTTAGALISHFDVQQYGVEDPETVEFDPATSTLFVLSNRQSGPIIAETTTSGALIQTVDVSASGAIKPAGLAWADASDGSGPKSFYLVDRGIDNNSDPNIVDGKLYELTTPGRSGPGSPPP